MTEESPWGPPPPPIPGVSPGYVLEGDVEPMEDYDIDAIETRYEDDVTGTRDEERY